MKTTLVSLEHVQSGVERLLSAPRDLAICGATIIETSADVQAAAQHRALFDAYVAELQRAIPPALAWWADLIEAAVDEHRTEKKAKRAVWQERPAGPVSDPVLVGIIRKYWLACAALNQETDLPVAPEIFLLQWVLDAGQDQAAEILSCMPYWPIGLDDSGRWI